MAGFQIRASLFLAFCACYTHAQSPTVVRHDIHLPTKSCELTLPTHLMVIFVACAPPSPSPPRTLWQQKRLSSKALKYSEEFYNFGLQPALFAVCCGSLINLPYLVWCVLYMSWTGLRPMNWKRWLPINLHPGAIISDIVLRCLFVLPAKSSFIYCLPKSLSTFSMSQSFYTIVEFDAWHRSPYHDQECFGYCLRRSCLICQFVQIQITPIYIVSRGIDGGEA